ncbi:hypothetical protein [Candidatus Francisella endociliophora]|uniref:hypothetical protein n=1 Tax=Candidatus Francisella endociliophora TaxID=653937 RepID=UPI000AC5E8C8|nr:hypothetical protein [Francisella sp. FSC1006]
MKIEGLNDWNLKVEEVSMNVYQITAVNENGIKIEKIGTDPKEIIETIKREIIKYEK